ncbi:uncharacterized protein [Cicer arietinum]|uniref:PAMP-induced secreted peptide 2 n=1 Tax=Cicer arietinum TaxID=3827 RepID=A0A1S2YS93_CICAR|nr:PAMP-induced secreted peptide 2 [Cicer arietinum]
MKSTILKTETFLVLFMLMNSAFIVLEARPLSIIETENSMNLVDWLSQYSLGAIKQGVPIETLEGIKDSGPSGGVGHKFTNTDTLGGIKDSGPSSGGQGHKFTNSETLGGIKNSGPSPGQGH